MATVNFPGTAAAPSIPEGGEVESEGSAFRMVLRTFAENKLAVAGGVIIVLLVIFCWLGPLLYHTNQTTPTLLLPDGLKATDAAPGAGHPLGMDYTGYDILGRLMKGGQISLEVGFAVGLAATVVGLIYGAISGFFGKWLDVVLMRIVDVGFAVPPIMLFLFVGKIFAPSVKLLIILLVGITWLIPARLVRGETLSLKTREYVQALRTMGGGSARAIGRHIIPNTIGTIVVQVTFAIADAIALLSLLQYFGFGLPPKDPTWGGMLSDAVNNAGAVNNGYWWQIYPAGLMIVLAVIAFNLVGDALRDAFEVRLQKR
jgi:peptide/nickel transport system permease protein